MRGIGPEITAIRLSVLATFLTNRHDNTKQMIWRYNLTAKVVGFEPINQSSILCTSSKKFGERDALATSGDCKSST